MERSLVRSAFAHDTWATTRLIDACLALEAHELQTDVPGTRGPMIDTLRHIVTGGAEDLRIITGDPALRLNGESMSLSELRGAQELVGAAWADLVARPFDPDEMVREIDDTDGYERTAPLALRIVGTLQHGTDHRSQICTALTTLGVSPPRIDAMAYGLAVG